MALKFYDNSFSLFGSRPVPRYNYPFLTPPPPFSKPFWVHPSDPSTSSRRGLNTRKYCCCRSAVIYIPSIVYRALHYRENKRCWAKKFQGEGRLSFFFLPFLKGGNRKKKINKKSPRAVEEELAPQHWLDRAVGPRPSHVTALFLSPSIQSIIIRKPTKKKGRREVTQLDVSCAITIKIAPFFSCGLRTTR